MKILCVEDDQSVAAALKRGLEQERHIVEVLHDGASGLAAACADVYDVIIMDWLLPEQDGLSVVRKIRSEGIRTPVLMLTAKDEVSSRVAGLHAGADDYLVKPFAFDELLARIQALGRRPPALQTTTISAGDVTLDTMSGDVQVGGVKVPLSKQETVVLEVLMRRKGRTVSKEELIAAAWDGEADILLNTVEAVIKNIRHKLSRAGAPTSFIRTRRGFGYEITNS